MTQPTPPPGILEYARAYRCHDCPADVAEPYLGDDGIWHLNIAHEDDCPMLAGTVPLRDAGAEAAAKAAEVTGRPALYVALEGKEATP